MPRPLGAPVGEVMSHGPALSQLSTSMMAAATGARRGTYDVGPPHEAVQSASTVGDPSAGQPIQSSGPAYSKMRHALRPT